MTSPPGRRADLVHFVLIATWVFAAYWPSLPNGFVWLDHREIEQKVFIATSWGDLARHFVADPQADGYFRPWYTVAHSFDYAVWGLNPLGFHLSSVLVHVANALLVFASARRLGAVSGVSLAAALLWGLHPRLTASVGLIHARGDVWCAFWLLVTFLTLVSGSARTSGRRLAVATMTLALAALAKESAYLFPAGLAVWFALSGRFARGSSMRRQALTTVGVLGAGVAVMIAWRFSVSPQVVTGGAPFGERIATFASVYLDDLVRLLTPLDLSVGDTTVRFSALSLAHQLATIGGVAGVAGIWVILWRRIPGTRAWIVLFHLALAPVSQLAPLLHFRADRYLYIPALFFVGAIVAAVAHLVGVHTSADASARGRARLATVITAITLVVWFGATTTRVRAFATEDTLFGPEVAREPRYREGLANLAVWRERQGDLAGAEALYRRALADDPAVFSYVPRATVVVNLSQNLLTQRKPAFAMALATEFPDVAGASSVSGILFRYNVALAAYKLARYEDALRGFTQYVDLMPGDAEGQYMLGQAAEQAGDKVRAKAAFEAYLRLRPNASDRAAILERIKNLSR